MIGDEAFSNDEATIISTPSLSEESDLAEKLDALFDEPLVHEEIHPESQTVVVTPEPTPPVAITAQTLSETGYSPITELVDSEIEVSNDEAWNTFAELAAGFEEFVTADIEPAQPVAKPFRADISLEQNHENEFVLSDQVTDKSAIPELFQNDNDNLAGILSSPQTDNSSTTPAFLNDEEFPHETLHTDELDISVIHAALNEGKDEDLDFSSVVSSLTAGIDTFLHENEQPHPEFGSEAHDNEPAAPMTFENAEMPPVHHRKEPDNEPASPTTFENAELPPTKASQLLTGEEFHDFHIEEALESHIPDVSGTGNGTSEFSVDTILSTNEMNSDEFADFMVGNDSTAEATIIGFDYPQEAPVPAFITDNLLSVTTEEDEFLADTSTKTVNDHADTDTSDYSEDEIRDILTTDPITSSNHPDIVEDDDDVPAHHNVANTAEFSIQELMSDLTFIHADLPEEPGHHDGNVTSHFSESQINEILTADVTESTDSFSTEQDSLVISAEAIANEDFQSSRDREISEDEEEFSLEDAPVQESTPIDITTSVFDVTEVQSLTDAIETSSDEHEFSVDSIEPVAIQAPENLIEEEDLLFNSDHSVADTTEFSFEEIKMFTAPTAETTPPEDDEFVSSSDLFSSDSERTIDEAVSPELFTQLPTVESTDNSWHEDTFDTESEDLAIILDTSVSLPDHVLTPTFADIYLQQNQPIIAKQIYERLLEKDADNDLYLERIEEIDTYISLHPESIHPVNPDVDYVDEEEQSEPHHRSLEGKRIDLQHREKLHEHRKKKGSHE